MAELVIQTSPNQRLFMVEKGEVSGAGGSYLIMYNNDVQRASRELTPAGFRVYLYLFGNKDKYKAGFSSQHCSECMGISKNSVLSGWNNLVQKEYLIQDEKVKNLYHIYPRPCNGELSLIIEKREFKTADGETYTFSYKELKEELGNVSQEDLDKTWNMGRRINNDKGDK